MILYANYMGDAGYLTNEKRSEKWLRWDFCDQGVCPKCMPKDVDLNEDFF